MPKKRSGGVIKRSRTRSGCVTCRDRHIKCDEQQPVCQNCIKSKRKCYRGIRLNFTQYSLYDPNENSKRPRPPPPQEYRILDQSITIASLYDAGKRSYLPFLHLHNPADLRESDLQFQQDIYSTIPASTILDYTEDDSVSELPGKLIKVRTSSRVPLNVSSISENYEISNQLLNESYFKNQFINSNHDNNQTPTFASNDQFVYSQPISTYFQSQPSDMAQRPIAPLLHMPPPYYSDRMTTGQFVYTNPNSLQPRHEYEPLIQNRETSSHIETNLYIHLIENEKYYWLLDLFNDLNIWKAVIPSICLNAADADPFLIDCLLHCSQQTQIPLERLLQEQLSRWKSFRAIYPIDTQNTSVFEPLLISISLIMLSIYLKFNGERLPEFHKIVLNNQVKIFNKLMVKLEECTKSRRSKSIVVVGCIHSIVTLKYFIVKEFRLDYGAHFDVHNVDITEDIVYPDNPSLLMDSNPYSNNGGLDLSSLLTVTNFEIANLNYGFKSIDIAQLKYNSQSIDVKSEAGEVRELLWYLIKLNYVISNPELAGSFSIDYNFIYKLGNNYLPGSSNQLTKSYQLGIHGSKLPLVTDQQKACYIMNEFIHKLINIDNPEIVREVNYRIECMFQQIDDGYGNIDSKQKWRRHFGWALR